MMIRIDTLKLARRLAAAGMPDAAADAIAEAMGDVDTSDLATMTDLAELRTATKADIAELRTALKTDIAELRAEIFRLMYLQTGTIIAAVAVIAAIARLFPH